MDGMSNFVTQASRASAASEAVVLWSIASSQYPQQNSLLCDEVAAKTISSLTVFAVNARRAMEVLPSKAQFSLTQARWRWSLSRPGDKVGSLHDALNRVVHARVLNVGFERLPDELSVIDGGAVVVPYVQVETDRRANAYVDLFAVSHAYIYQVLPLLLSGGPSHAA
jgi:hypothetical protein